VARGSNRALGGQRQATLLNGDSIMKDDHPTAASNPTSGPMNWRLFFLLWVASVISIILVLPYALAMIPASLSSKLPPLYLLLPLQVAQGAIFLGVMTLAGLFFANRIGLSAPILEGEMGTQLLFSGSPGERRIGKG
jgi:hypothetical protein